MARTKATGASRSSSTKGSKSAVAEAVRSLTFDAGATQAAAEASVAVRKPGFERLLVAIDGSAGSKNALAWAKTLAAEFSSRVVCAHVQEPPSLRAAFSPTFDLDRVEREAQKVLQDAIEALRKADVRAEKVLLKGFVVRRMVVLAQEKDVDVVIVGSRGRGPWSRFLLGSVADGLKNSLDRSVLIARTTQRPRRILAPVDGSRESVRAAQAALELARRFDAHLTILYVVPSEAKAPAAQARPQVEAIERDLDFDGVHPTVELQAGRPAETIVERAERTNADLIVMGSRGLTGLRTVVPGGVSNRVAHAAPCSVLLVKTEV